MSEPFMGEIRIMAFNFAPQGWAMCNGQLLPINQNQALFALLGTKFGGNGQTNFALPDFRGRVGIHAGDSHSSVGERGGEEAHTLILSEMPAHNHALIASQSIGDKVNPNFGGTGFILAADPGNIYSAALNNLGTLNAGSLSNVGGSQPHTNMMPYLTMTFCIALQGLFPTQD
ncbi:MAG TPA: tail fiber protein [Thermoanaerobaculia bacterium]|jgi:microcystin-dependent protein